MPVDRSRYPANWKQISQRIRFEVAGNRCQFCGAENYQPHPETGSKVILTVAHLNHDTTDNSDDNLRALCQRCHNRHDVEYRKKNRAATHASKKQAAIEATGQQPLFDTEVS